MEDKNSVPNYISVKVCDDLYQLIAQEAQSSGENLIDVVVRVMAEHYKRPELGRVPRKTRRRKPLREELAT